MNRYSKYRIKDTDKFNGNDFPKVDDELQDLKKILAVAPNDFKEIMVISYLKDHSLKNEWIAANPVLSNLITGGTCITDHMQSLFESSRNNNSFTRDLEDHIRNTIM